MYDTMASALEKAADDPGVQVVLIHGQSDGFSSGNGLQDFVQAPPTGRGLPSAGSSPRSARPEADRRRSGWSGGRHRDHHATALRPRVRRGGHAVSVALREPGAAAGSRLSLLLPQQIGYRRAAELILLGEPFSATTALQDGLITGIAADGGAALAMATATAGKLAAKPPAALRQAKMLMKQARVEATATQIRSEMTGFVDQLHSPEAAEALKAFFEKRPPDFSQFA